MHTHKMTLYSQTCATGRGAGEEKEKRAEGFTWMCYTAKPWATSCGPKQKGISAECYNCNKISETCGHNLFFNL